MSRKDFICSFCNRKQTEVKKLIVGPSVYICDFCTNICAQILHENENENHSKENTQENYIEQLTPENIYEQLDSVAASQEDAKRELALAAYLHSLKIHQYEKEKLKDENNSNVEHIKEKENTVKLNKNNLLLIGPTGTGKTLLVSTLAKILNVAHVIIDANSLTEAGYVGDDADSIVKKLFHSIYLESKNIEECIRKTEFGIICIDEIDKKYSMDSIANRDVSGKGVQQNLLRIIEGADVQIVIDGKKSTENTITINTSNILFITMGAFEGLDKIISRNLKHKTALGITEVKKEKIFIEEKKSTVQISLIQKKEEDYNNLIKCFKKEYLLDFGIIKELLGRLHTIVFFKKLSENDLIEILCHKKNNLIEEYNYIFSLHNMKLIYDESVIRAIAQEAIVDNMGARSLRSIVHKIFSSTLFSIPTTHKENINKKYLVRLMKKNDGFHVKIEDIEEIEDQQNKNHKIKESEINSNNTAEIKS